MARPRDPELVELLKKFVCVRKIQINDLDFARFEFDFELTWSICLLNGDGTLYGRYGTRSVRDRKRNVKFDPDVSHLERDGMPEDMSLEGFKSSLRATLALHARYQSGESERLRTQLKAKTGDAWPWPNPASMPGVKRSCTHCHQVNSNLVLHHRKVTPMAVPDSILWSFPMPDELGMSLDPERAVRVARVSPGSEADKAGLQKGDQVLAMAGQPMLSPADVQWVLHHAPEDKHLHIKVSRTAKASSVDTAETVSFADLRLFIPKDWRRRGSFAWRWRSIRETLARVLDGEAWHCNDLPPERRGQLKIDEESLAIEVLGNMRKKEPRLQTGDVILAVDDNANIRNTSEFYAYIFQRKLAGSQLVLTVLREGSRIRIVIPVS